MKARIEHWRTHQPSSPDDDAIVVDVMLGGESGWELIRALQGDPRCRAAPIVVLSARAHLALPPGLRPCAA